MFNISKISYEVIHEWKPNWNNSYLEGWNKKVNVFGVISRNGGLLL